MSSAPSTLGRGFEAQRLNILVLLTSASIAASRFGSPQLHQPLPPSGALPYMLKASTYAEVIAARASTAKFSGEQRPQFQYPSPHRFVGDIQSSLGEQILNVAIPERETQIEPNACRMIAGGNWWRTNEIVMRHLTRQPDAPYRSRDKGPGAAFS